MDSWFDELPRLLKHFPDYNELHTVDELRGRSEVLPLGLDLDRLDAWRPIPEPPGRPPLILWNHRWEYDKNPAEFFQALYTLAGRGIDFRLAVLGESFVRVPPEFEEARERLGDRIVQFGYLDHPQDYVHWLWRADLIVSTAFHDFFGAAVVEAVYCRTFPILPRRLAYPQFIPEALHPHCLYDDHDSLVSLLEAALKKAAEGVTNPEVRRESDHHLDMLRRRVAVYAWSQMASEYDRRLEAIHRDASCRHTQRSR